MTGPAKSYIGVAQPADGSSEYNALDFLVRQAIGKMATSALVRVEAVDTSAQTVDVSLLVAQLDGAGNATPHGTVYGLPYGRIQAGTSAVIIDPIVGDLGLACFASRDISSVQTTRAAALPGSRRQYDYSDGIYVCSVLGAAPTHFVRITPDDGVEVTSTVRVVVTSPDITLDGPVTFTEAFTAPDATINGKLFSTHHHSGVTTGGGTSGPPS